MSKVYKPLIIGLALSISFLGNFSPVMVRAADTIGLSDLDVAELFSIVAVPSLLLESFKSTIDSSMGVINLLEQGDPLYKAFLALSAPVLAVLLIWEITKVLMGKTKIQKLFVNFIMVLVMPALYIGGFILTVSIANLLIQAFLNNTSYVDSVKSNMENFVRIAAVEVNNQNLPQRTLANLWSVITRSTGVVGSAVGVVANPAISQYKIVVQLLSWTYFLTAIVNWFAMFIIDWFLKILFFLSPLVAVSHINGWGNGFIRKYWAAFIDCIVAKVAFHFVFFLINETIKTQFDTNVKGVNLGFALFCICSYLAMAVIVLKVRELFDFIDTSYNSVEQTNNTPLSMVQNVAGGTVNLGSRAMQTISSFSNFKK